MTSTRLQVRSTSGELLGIFPKGEMAAVKALVAQHPGASVKVTVSIDSPCHLHPAYSADNCPSCGTSARI